MSAVTIERNVHQGEFVGLASHEIVRADCRTTSFQQVCDLAVRHHGFRGAGAVLADSDGALRFVAGAGNDGQQALGELTKTNTLGYWAGGLIVAAFRQHRVCISDPGNDESFRPWGQVKRSPGIGVLVAIPVLDAGSCIGVFLFFLSDSDHLSDDVMRLMEGLVEASSSGGPG